MTAANAPRRKATLNQASDRRNRLRRQSRRLASLERLEPRLAMAVVTCDRASDGIEGVEGEDPRFVCRLSSPSSQDTMLTYEVGGTATAGVDYEPLSGSLLIPAGQTSAGIVVHTLDDALGEQDETITIRPTGLPVHASDVYLGVSGELNLSFGGTGVQRVRFQDAISVGRKVLFQSDGKRLLVGEATVAGALRYEVARFNSDGSRDAGFGDKGVAGFDFAGKQGRAYSAALQPDGKILVVGQVVIGNQTVWGIARLTTAGQLDPSFGTAGQTLIDFAGTSNDSATGVAVQADGKIVVGGIASSGFPTSDYALARLNPDGSLDATFGSNGTVRTDFGAHDGVNTMLLQSDGKIVLGGITSTGSPRWGMARYNSNGTLDGSFGGGGFVSLLLNGANSQAIFGLAQQADGKIVATGYVGWAYFGPSDVLLARYNIDGSLDSTFGSGGYVFNNVHGQDFGKSVAMLPDGRILVSGYTSTNAGDTSALLLCYEANGSLSPTFGVGGVVTNDLGPGDDDALSVAVGSGGEILIGGYTGGEGFGDAFIAEYQHTATVTIRDDEGPANAPGAIIERTGQEFATIGAAIQAAQAGDHIWIRNGLYDENVVISKPLTLQAMHVGGAVIDGPGMDVNDGKVIEAFADVTLYGLDLQNGHNGVYQRDVGATITVRRVVVTNVLAAFIINNSGGRGGNFDIENSTIVGADTALAINDGGTIRGTNLIISDTRVAYGILNGDAIVPDHNLLFNVAEVSSGVGVTGDPAQLVADPRFVDRAHGDFRLTSRSPAIDSGRLTGTPYRDMAPDRGAYEFDGTADVNLPPVANDDAFTIENNGLPRVLDLLSNDTFAPDVDESLSVAEVGGGNHGGRIIVGPGGQSVIYTPAPGYTGVETFEYTLSDGRGGTATGLVTIDVTPNVGDDVVIYAAFVDATGRPITSVAVGEHFTLQIYVMDLRSPGVGVFSSYADFYYDFVRGRVAGPILPGEGFPYGRGGNNDIVGLLDEVGGYSFSHAPDEFGPQLMFSLDFEATEAGAFNVFADPADDAENSQVVVYESLYVTPVERVRYEGATLQIATRRPVARDDVYDAVEDAPLVVMSPGMLLNDSPGDGATMQSLLVSSPSHGTVQLEADGGFTYVPQSDYFGLDTFVYRAFDGVLESPPATVTISVAGVNDPPVAAGELFELNEDQSLSVTVPGLLSNDRDADGDLLSVQLAASPMHGVLTLAGNGSFQYQPDPNYNGDDSFFYVVTDGQSWSGIVEARFQIAAVNDAPAVISTNFSTTEDMPVALDFTVDDGDPEAIQATVVEVTSLPRHGVLLLSDGTPVTANQLPLSAAPAALRYQPDSNWFGEDRFELVAHDDGGVERDGVDTSLPVTVSLHVAAVNDAPVGGADLYRTGRNHTLVVDATHGVLANDSDVDSAVLSARLIHGPGDGSLTLNPDGSFVFVPNIGFTGSTRFVYRVTDGVTESGDIAVDLVVSTPELEITIGFVDASGRATTQLVAGETGWVEYYVRDISVSARGTFAAYFDSTFDAAVVGLSGPIVYGTTFANAHSGDLATPGLVDELGASDDFRGRGGNRILLARIPLAALSEGSTEFVTDPADTSPEHDSLLWGNSAPLHTDEILFGRATLTVLAPVVAVDDQAALDEDSGASILHVLANDRYSSGLSATITQLTSASNGQVTISADGQSVIYRPAPNYFGADQFTYTLTDSHGTADTAVVSIDVRPVNDPPRAFDDRASVVEDSRDVRIDPLANDDSVPDAAEQLRIIGVSAGDKGGRATIIDGGSAIAYTPAADFFGTETFTYTIADPAGATASATIRVNVDDMNDPPTAGDDSFVFYDSNGAKQLDLLANDSSAPDTGETLRITSVTQPSHGRVTMTADGRRVTFVNDSGFIGDQSFSYMVGDGRGGTAQATVFVSTVHYWQNSRNPLDVNADLFVSPIDALLVINYLNSHGAGPLPLPPDGTLTPPPYLDVNGDNFVSPVDALLIINYLNRRGGGGQGEGEEATAAGASPLSAGFAFRDLSKDDGATSPAVANQGSNATGASSHFAELAAVIDELGMNVKRRWQGGLVDIARDSVAAADTNSDVDAIMENW